MEYIPFYTEHSANTLSKYDGMATLALNTFHELEEFFEQLDDSMDYDEAHGGGHLDVHQINANIKSLADRVHGELIDLRGFVSELKKTIPDCVEPKRLTPAVNHLGWLVNEIEKRWEALKGMSHERKH